MKISIIHSMRSSLTLKTAFTVLLVLFSSVELAMAQNPPTGPAGGDLTGTYPNPTLAIPRVQRTGDLMTGQLTISVPNAGGLVFPFTLTSSGTSGAGRGISFQFNLPQSGLNGLGAEIVAARETAGQNTYFAFSNHNGTAMAETFRIAANGNVGIGTNAPNSKLDVNGNVNFRGGSTFFRQSTGLAGGEGAAIGIGATANNESTFALSVYRAGVYTNRMVVDSFGRIILQPSNDFNVGIGVASPGFKLDVSGQVNSSGGLCMAGDCKTAWSQVGGSQWTTAGSIIHYSSGSVGIGTSTPAFDSNPGKFLNVNGGAGAIGSIGAAGGTSSNGTSVGQVAFINSNLGTTDKRVATIVGATDTATNSGLIDFYTASTGTWPASRMRINAAGNIGIGTTSPGTKLDVAGTVRAGNADTNMGTHASYGTTYSAFWRQGADYSLLTNGTHSYLNAPSGSGNIYLRAGNTDKMILQGSNGFIGIGTATPATKLHVVGDLTVTGNIAAKYQDIAEWVESSSTAPSGTVMVLDPSTTNRVMASSQAYDTRVAGVVSAQPGLTLGEAGDNKVMVATTGRVKVRVDATAAPIQVGDLLVTSDTPGVAMKSLPINVGGVQIHRPGTLIGKALEPLATGTGEILVLLSLQ